jgi:hypothetical protein
LRSRRRLNVARPVAERAPDEERLSLYPLSFDEALRTALRVDPAKVDTEEAKPDGDRS